MDRRNLALVLSAVIVVRYYGILWWWWRAVIKAASSASSFSWEPTADPPAPYGSPRPDIAQATSTVDKVTGWSTV